MLETYQCYRPKPTDTYGTKERDGLACLKAQINAAILSFRKRLQTCKKPAIGHFEHAVWVDVTSINVSCFFTIIKTVSISCNWTDQLLLTYKITLCTSHSHSFRYGWSILMKFTCLTAINWLKIQQIYTLFHCLKWVPLEDETTTKFLQISNLVYSAPETNNQRHLT